ncbi:hypothetical protein EV356DRAFT_517470 [Viridothelium virens]|uniref:Uncharacterized protein n=1 Tax=Viridothelium virens TaxID=1048519 RepID=A0A6A6H384_VIRVR|nr:hypothetical protein EV356DRAFT_517470 [Viridothelium virens]
MPVYSNTPLYAFMDISLLRLQSLANTDDEVSGTLTTNFAGDANIEFKALSYTWEIWTENHMIGSTLLQFENAPIRASLFEVGRQENGKMAVQMERCCSNGASRTSSFSVHVQAHNPESLAELLSPMWKACLHILSTSPKKSKIRARSLIPMVTSERAIPEGSHA